ncbi:sunset domain-containing protein [Mesorhizobium sp. 43Arga]
MPAMATWLNRCPPPRRGFWRLEYLFALILVPVAVVLSHFPDIIGAAPSLMQPEGIGDTVPSTSLYHVPGQEHYWETKISPQYGERWFCTEEEARAACWRKARR